MKGILVNLHYHGRNPTILMQAIIFQFPYHAKNYDERMALGKLFDKKMMRVSWVLVTLGSMPSCVFLYTTHNKKGLNARLGLGQL